MKYYAVKRIDDQACSTRSGEWSKEREESLKEEGYEVFTDKEQANEYLKKIRKEKGPE